ncbi:MAG: UDP-N-acetylmuramoyl-L-alanyl-D-glutamate--2,6-diaminopimelate ligase [Thermoanaerobaculia bacterium]|nr:UDP-N-acetylmuramoyl-L-alanyl-D-glutamate--2,6-diaminopimelate ligase [Thermoanaerobaculia bacterium]
MRDLLPVPAGAADLEVGGIAHDSRAVRRGDLFVAVVGERFDGRRFAARAREAGAVAALGPGPAPPGYDGVWLPAPDPRALLGPLSARLFGHPDRELVMAGVTGTNGKSTVVALMQAILEASGLRAGRIGTLGQSFGPLSLEAARTTPEAPELFRTLREMRDAGAQAVAMEVSSHGLAQGRVDGARFDVAVFTNLTRDHLDYHADLESYFAAKRRLFERLKPRGVAVVNADDPFGARLAAELPECVTWGESGRVRVARAHLDERGIQAVFATPRGELEVASSLLGGYNLSNLAAAVAAAEALELAPEAIARGLAAVEPLPGRLERVGPARPFPAFVDFAHTPAALEAAIRSLRELSGRRIVVVFGCGGERDPGKRAPMGRVAGELADVAILTTDNPRGEDPDRILAAVEEGLVQSGGRWEVEPDRRTAIRRAMALAGPDAAVLVAGKGHETTQIVGDQVLPFSDREEILAAREEGRGSGTAS